MKISYQVTAYFVMVLLVISAGTGLMLNRIHTMDVAHHRLNQEWKELQLITGFLNSADQLLTEISLSTETELLQNGYVDKIEAMIGELDEIRAESVQSEQFEEEGHAEKEKLDFVMMYDDFQAFIKTAAAAARGRDPDRRGDFKQQLVMQLGKMRATGNELQEFYLERMGEAAQYARKSRVQLWDRALLVSGVFVVLLAIMAFWFIRMINKNTLSMLEREKNITIGLLAQSLSHEIRNPLGIIKSSTSVIRKKLPPESEEYEIAGFLTDEVDRIDGLIGQLVNLRTDTAGLIRPEDPAPILQQVILLLTGVCQKAGVTINFFNEAGHRTVSCDRNQIKQVLINIILNAIEISPPQETVSVTARTDQGMYHIEVRDNGPGFTKGQAARVFDPFYTTKKNGSGLGLFVARHMLEANGGMIHLEPAPHGGVVVISLRLAEGGRAV